MTERILYEEIPEFTKDLAKLRRRFRTLVQDLELAKKAAIELYHLQHIDNQSVFLIPNLGSTQVLFCKVKKFACRALKGRGNRSGIRVIYAFFPEELRVVFIEIYFKGDKENEDRARIKDFLRTLDPGP